VLTAQLQPHFLFNTLHTIGSLILQRKNEDAMQMLAQLGELLRITLHRQTAESIPLGEELDHLKRYLQIEEMRFGDRLTVEWDVEPAATRALVPPLILQPLVENALKHGVADRIERATLLIRAAMAGDRLHVAVRNDGPTLPSTWALDSSKGFGLRNVHERLLTRGGSCTLRVENAGTQGVLATIDMPAQMEAADA
jgi:LytS/YehU family sensor histidine kinase